MFYALLQKNSSNISVSQNLEIQLLVIHMQAVFLYFL